MTENENEKVEKEKEVIEPKESIVETETNYLALLSRLEPKEVISIELVIEKVLRAYSKFNHDFGSTQIFQATLDLMNLFLNNGFITAFQEKDYEVLSYTWSLLSANAKSYIEYIYEQF